MSKAKLSEVNVDVDFGVFKLGTKWVDDPRLRDAAWALSIELQTRVATQPVGSEHGIIRDALTSLHELFRIFREVLRAGGPALGSGPDTIGGTALAVLNRALRPFLSEWHPRLLEWEASRGTRSPEHERAWSEATRCRVLLVDLQKGLAQYAELLAQYASKPPKGR